MEWYEKEQAFADRLNSGKISADIWRYIPKKLMGCIEDAYINDDGYWIYLAEGYTAYDGGSDSSTIHEYMIADLREAIKSIRKVEQ